MAITGQPTTTTTPPIVLPRKAGASLHAQLLRVTASGHDADQVRGDLRRVIKDYTNATCVFHLQQDQYGEFGANGCDAEGDLEASEKTVNILLSVATLAVTRGTTQVKALDNQSQVVCAPVSVAGGPGEILAAVIATDVTNVHSALFALELAASYQRFWARGNIAVANNWKLNSLAAIVELVSNIEQQTSVDAAAITLVNDVAKFLGCSRVALATGDVDDLQLRAISGLNNFDQNSETVALIREALAESRFHDGLSVWPAVDNKRSALLAHKALASQLNLKSVLTAELKNVDGNTMGVWLFADNGDAISGDRFRNFIRAASPRVASALQILQRSEQGIVARGKQRLFGLFADRKGKATLAAFALLLGIMLLPVPYRVRCQCVIEPIARRFAVAPFDGMVEEGLVEPGDVVSAGSLLARMEGRELKWELSAAAAKRGQAQKKREIELTERNVPQVLIAQLEVEELDAQIDVLRYRTEHLEVKAPVDGVVLSGLLEKGQAAPVGTGEVLYEIGPLGELRVEIEVPASEVANVAAGQTVKIWINGFESEPIVATIQQLQPRSELRHDQNVFIAKLDIQNPGKSLRPGMRGTARISGPRRPLVWNLFHKPWEFIVSRLTWW